MSIAQNVSAGWYPDQSGRLRWWDGAQWTEHFAPVVQPVAQPAHHQGPMTHRDLTVRRDVIYNREQKGHSIILHVLFGGVLLWIHTIYYAVSPNHYFHA